MGYTEDSLDKIVKPEKVIITIDVCFVLIDYLRENRGWKCKKNGSRQVISGHKKLQEWFNLTMELNFPKFFEYENILCQD